MQREIIFMNPSVFIKEDELVIRNLPIKKTPGLGDFIDEG